MIGCSYSVLVPFDRCVIGAEMRTREALRGTARHQGFPARPPRRPLPHASRRVEFFNVILELKLTQKEKEALVPYLLCL